MQIGREICKSEILWQGRWIKVENEKHGSLDEMKREREKRKKREIGTYSVWRACCWSGLGAESQAAGMAASSNPRNLWFASRSRPPRSLLALSPRCTETWCLWQKKISIIRLLTDAKTLHFLLNETNISTQRNGICNAYTLRTIQNSVERRISIFPPIKPKKLY